MILPLFTSAITPEENAFLISIPSYEEISDIVRHLNSLKSLGPDGLNGLFFKFAWEVVSSDVIHLLRSFFSNDIDLS